MRTSSCAVLPHRRIAASTHALTNVATVVAVGLVLASLTGCTTVIRASEAPTSRPIRVTSSAPIALVPPTIEMAAGTVIGGHAVNPDRQYTLVHEWQSTFTVDPNEFNHSLRDELTTLGYRPATGSIAPFGLQPVVVRLVYNLFGSDASVGWSEAEITVRWQVLGPAPFSVETRGSAMAQMHNLASIFQAFRIALRNFLADSRFSDLVSSNPSRPAPVAVNVPTPETRPEVPVLAPSAPAVVPPAPSGALQRIRRPVEVQKDLDLQAAAQRARSSVVTVLVGDSWGSGVALTAEGLIVTQASLVEGQGAIAIVNATGRQVPATFVRADAATGLALIQASGVNFEPLALNLAPSSGGESIMAIGTPFHPALSFSVSPGRITNASAAALDTDVPVSQGNAGGPIVDVRARGTGVIVWEAGASGESARARAVPAGAVFRALGLAYADGEKP